MPDDHASSSDTPRRDETSASTGTPEALHGDPPTLPPFSAGAGPRPLTIAGMPAVDVFGGADDLFVNVPPLGPRPVTGPVPTLPVAAARPVTGPVPTLPSVAAKSGGSRAKVGVPPPPAGGATSTSPKQSTAAKPLGPPPQPPRSPVAKPAETPATAPAKATSQARPAATASTPPDSDIVLPPDLEFELSVGLIDPAEVYRRARERVANATAEAKPVEAKPIVETKPAVKAKPLAEAKPIVAAKPVAAKPIVAAKPKIEAKPLEQPKSSGAEPAAFIDDRESPPPRAADSPSTESSDSNVPAITESAVAPVAVVDTGIRDTMIAEPASADSASLPTVDSSAPVDSATLEPASAESHDHVPVEPARESSESIDLSQPARDTTSNVDGTTPSKPSHKPSQPPAAERAKALAPPAPRSPIDDDRPRLGVPYEPPAVVVRLPIPDAESEPESAGQQEPEEPSARGPIALPKPGRAPAAPARAPVPPADAGKVVPLPVLARPEGAPNPIGQEDTGALIDGMADEMVAQARRAPVATLVMEVPNEPRAQPANRNRRKLLIGFLLFAIAASLVVALLPNDDDDDDQEDSFVASDEAPERPTIELRPEPEPLAPADAPTPPTEPPPTEPEPPPPTEPEPPPTEPAPTDEAVDKPKSGKSTKPKSDKPSDPEPTVSTSPKPDPEPKPTAGKTEPVDNRDAKQLYDAAKSAYDKGKASEAYKLALASYKKGAKPKTAELMLLAACKLGDKGKASSALDKVSGLRKPALRKQCKTLGTSI